ncbi:MAG: FtsX-like permease family protein [bacterium]
MIRFLLKGLLRDKSRSLFPILVVVAGVFLTVLCHAWLNGVIGDMIDANANFSTGHVKITTKAYAENADQVPNDLAFIGVDDLLGELRTEYPDMIWTPRIKFGGLLDVPDENGETKSQGPVIGLAVDLLSEGTPEIATLNIEKSIVRGRLPEKQGEILISDEFATRLRVEPGGTGTLIGSSMYGSMTFQNFTIVGTVSFGISAMDRAAMVLDISDAQTALNMEDAAGEILGYFNNRIYVDARAARLAETFNVHYQTSENEFDPVMITLKNQNDLATYLDMVDYMVALLLTVFVFAMSIVLWNTGLIAGLRRYGEIGVRLAIGEEKGHVYRAMILESICVGCIGSVIGTMIGLGISFYLQNHGIDISAWMQKSTMLFSSVMRAKITAGTYFIGFIPGLLSMVLGTMLSGIGIYKRQTSQLFKELEA